MRTPKPLRCLALLHTLLALVPIAFSLSAKAQVGYVWAKGIQGPGWYDYGLDANCDPTGNVFICGDFEGNANIGGTVYNGLGSSDMYTCRLDPDGNFVWTSHQGSTSTERNFSVDVGQNGDVFTCGYGKIPYPAPPESNLHQWDAINQRLRANGTVVWGRAMQGDVYSESNDVVGDGASNCYAAGVLKYHGWYGTDTLEGHGSKDAYLVKFDSLGNYVWGLTMGGNLDDIAQTIDMDSQGNVWVGGSFSAGSQFGDSTVYATGNTDGFIAKFDPSGNLLMVRSFTGPGFGEVYELALSDDGDCYFTGTYSGTMNLGGHSITASDTLDILYGKMRTDGTVAWARTAGGFDFDISQDLELDASENIYIAGYFFGDLTWQGNSQTSQAYDDMFFAKTDSNGTLLQLVVAGDAYSRDAFGISVDIAENVIVTGSFADTMTFGATQLYSSGFNTDIFVAKYATRTQQIGVPTVVGSPYCATDQFQVTFSAWGYFPQTNVFSLELSDANGNFSTPTVIGTLTSGYGGTIIGTVPNGVAAGNQYRMRVAASQPTIAGPDNGTDIALTSITSIPVAIIGDTVLCNGNPVTLSVDPGFDHQMWSTGDTSQSIVVFAPGPVSVQATDTNGCTNSSQVTVDYCVAMPSPAEPMGLVLSPNPAHLLTHLHYSSPIQGTCRLQLIDGLGQIVLEQEVKHMGASSAYPLQLHALRSGIYLVKFVTDQGTTTIPLLVQ